MAATPSETGITRDALPPLEDARTWTLQGDKLRDGSCRYEYRGERAEIPAEGWVLRTIEVDMSACRKLMEEGIPSVPLGPDSSLPTTIELVAPEISSAKPLQATNSPLASSVSSTRGAWQRVVWTDIIGVTVNHDVTQINWTYNGSTVSSGNAAGYWYRLGGWEIVSTSVTQGFFSGAFRGQTTATFRNQGFCGPGNPAVYVYHYYNRVWGHANGTSTRAFSTNSVNECFPLFVDFQSAYGQWVIMTRDELQAEPKGSMIHRFGVAIGVGLLLALLTDLWPAAGFPLAILTIAALAFMTLTRRPLDPYRLVEVAGVMLGLGGLFAYGLARGLTLCGQSEDFCGNANLIPLAALTFAMIGLGIVAAGVAYWRFQTHRARSRR